MAQKTFVDPRKYVVGVDISPEQYQEAILKIADWFSESRVTKEPAAAAKQAVQECLDGVTKEGTPWFAAALVPLANRIKAKCRFDLDTMQPLRKSSEKTRIRKQKDKDREERKRVARAEDPLIPEELRKDLKRSARYGDNPHVLLSSAEERRWKELSRAYVSQFPELGTINAEAELNMLCDLHILTERGRMNVLQGKGAVSDDMFKGATDALQKLKRALGIHPDQLAKRVQEHEDSSVAAAVARLSALGDWRTVRAKFFIEEMIQAYQMYMSLNADGSGYQLDEIGLFGMTKCRTCSCTKCGHRNFAGISIDEVEQFLVEKGALELIPEPAQEAVLNAVVTPPSPDIPTS